MNTKVESGPERSDLYRDPVPFQGRSLEGVPLRDDSTELARSFHAEVPAEDLFPVEPCADEPGMTSFVIADAAIDVENEDHALFERQAAYARSIGIGGIRGRDSACAATGNRGVAQARKASNDRWAAFASASRTAPISFGDDAHRILTLVEHRTASCSDQVGTVGGPYRDVDLPGALDGSHAAHCIPEHRGRRPDWETGFGRVSGEWNECPFSRRERILDALSEGDSLGVARAAGIESAVEDGSAACGKRPSSQCSAMVNMISDLGDRCGQVATGPHGSRGTRLLQLIEMLDNVVVVV